MRKASLRDGVRVHCKFIFSALGVANVSLFLHDVLVSGEGCKRLTLPRCYGTRSCTALLTAIISRTIVTLLLLLLLLVVVLVMRSHQMVASDVVGY